MKKTRLLIAVMLGIAPLAATAQSSHSAHGTAPAHASATAGAMSEGEIRKVDKEAKKLTIRHGPLANLDMPPMTMVFQVKDPAMVDQVKAGDKVKFVAEQDGGAYIVTRIEVAN